MDKSDDMILGMKLVRDDITAEVSTRVILSSLFEIIFPQSFRQKESKGKPCRHSA